MRESRSWRMVSRRRRRWRALLVSREGEPGGRCELASGANPPGEGADAPIRSRERLSEFECKRILRCYGIPVTSEALATSAENAVVQARELGYPVALKIQSGEILHKTEAGGIRLDLASEGEVRAAYQEILASSKRFAPGAAIRGVLVQEMVQGGVEVIIGTTRDPVFGPVVMFGLGGIFVEALRDVSFRVAPVMRRDAEEMIREIRGYRVLEGMRGKPPADIDAIVEAILRVSQLVTDYADEIEEIDINPLVVFSRGRRPSMTRPGGGIGRKPARRTRAASPGDLAARAQTSQERDMTEEGTLTTSPRISPRRPSRGFAS
jgi:acyl-CoA synthetase (NDP forming)